MWSYLALGGLALAYFYYRKQQKQSASTTQGALSVPTVPMQAQSSTNNLPSEVAQGAGMPYTIYGPDVYLNVNNNVTSTTTNPPPPPPKQPPPKKPPPKQPPPANNWWGWGNTFLGDWENFNIPKPS